MTLTCYKQECGGFVFTVKSFLLCSSCVMQDLWKWMISSVWDMAVFQLTLSHECHCQNHQNHSTSPCNYFTGTHVALFFITVILIHRWQGCHFLDSHSQYFCCTIVTKHALNCINDTQTSICAFPRSMFPILCHSAEAAGTVDFIHEWRTTKRPGLLVQLNIHCAPLMHLINQNRPVLL